jgi:murein DD-endopeptidase MepM/ murein hydrolase activator NlpD
MTANRAHLSADQRHRFWRAGISAVLAAFGCLGVVTAFGIAPPSSLDVQALQAVEPPSGFGLEPVGTIGDRDFHYSPPVRRGDTVSDVLVRAGVSSTDINRLLGEASVRRLLRELRPGQGVDVGVGSDGQLANLSFFDSDGRRVEIDATTDNIATRVLQTNAQTVPRFASGEIRNSLFGATDDAGIPDAVAVQLAEIFSGLIDFHRGLRKGDRFWLVYEQNLRDGEVVSSGRVIAAEFRNGDVTHSAYWFQLNGQPGAYFNADGKSLQRQFLMSPLEFSRVTSSFSTARLHPVLQEWRAHRGIDYGARSGTRVRATADGVIETAGYSGGYGNLVVIRHGNTYSTAYGHLSGFAPGIRRGSRVGKGDTVGYVGATGLTTGPHLHYEFRVNGAQIDPRAARVAEATPLIGDSRRAFEHQRAFALQQIGFARQTLVANFE